VRLELRTSRPETGRLWRARARPPAGWIVAVGVLASFALRGAFLGGIATALTVVALHPSATVSIVFFLILMVALGLVELRRNAPQWFAWLLGRMP
jgi:sulfite exporter TauE/SafE